MTVAVLGLPYDAHSSHLRGPALAPAAVREALHSGSANYFSELGADLQPGNRSWVDLGDLNVPEDAEAALATITEAVNAAIDTHHAVLSIGGDHFVTWPVMRAIEAHHPQLTIVHFDAHPDLYDELDGDRYSHACPFARIMEEELANRLVQLGIRTMTDHQREQAERFGVEVIDYGTWNGRVPELAGPVYISIDVDGLDPAYAPGVSHLEPGGMSTRLLIDSLHQIAKMDVQVVGADVVEINPNQDINGMTAMVGAKLLRELLGVMQDAD